MRLVAALIADEMLEPTPAEVEAEEAELLLELGEEEALLLEGEELPPPP